MFNPLKATLIAILAGALTAPFHTLSSSTDEVDVDFVAYGMEFTPLEITASPTLPGKTLKAISVATGISIQKFGKGRVFSETLEQEGVPHRGRLSSMPFELDGQLHHALIALTPTGAFWTAAVVDESGAPLEEWDHTLGNFKHYPVP